MTILTDVDGVLLRWNEAFHEWMRTQHKLKPICFDSYDLSICYGLDKDRSLALINEFNSSAQIGFLPPMDDAVKQVRRLHEEHGAIFHAISSMGTNPYAIKLRKQNLYRLFGEHVFSDVTVIGCGDHKREILKRYEGTDFIWLEDNIENANDGASLGLRSFLFNRYYNMHHRGREDFQRISSWDQLITYI